MLKNKVAIVTGASRGIGKAVAFKLAQHEVQVVLFGSSEQIQQSAEELEHLGHRVLAIRGDVARENEVNDCVSKTIEHFGKIDILVNNAGIGFFKDVEATSLEEWQRLFEVNVQGVFLFTKAVLPYMKERGQGTIINIASDVARRTIPKGAAYTASKYAVQGFTGSVAQEVRKLGIRVGTINPGMVDTYFNNTVQGDPQKKDWLKVEDVADAVLYMASAPKHMVVDEVMLHPLIQEYPNV
ncbi:NADP-dependent 3-hydroxy acid dehydrogenase YdfG [Caldalkalibacillus uzonensis]|uniref:NADP-dependent 3-hydroxy acid dehydrogenase YdfG n=1 Tax=Caldalkalibacillus uzonensis TaxID=353224 RepID=A0ABU0CUE3_9BACI|nr:SDR family oxidoreductase [Caldalkalibacillus uzonensis]MDQ0340031.1 NADP-dependent 3-hydroxy acid dehydrogenase YdfG [Caldalkalibacillus uzonensis]